jgi:hypothetical protein
VVLQRNEAGTIRRDDIEMLVFLIAIIRTADG